MSRIILLALFSFACTQPVVLEQEPFVPDEGIEEGSGLDQEAIEEAERALHLAKLRGEQSILEMELELDHSFEDLARAEKSLELFHEIQAPSRITRSELSLEWSRDSILETEEELAQLEQLYGDAEFAEKTGEIVIGRTKRRLVRERRSLELEEQEFRLEVEHEIPQEARDLEREVEESRLALRGIKVELEALRIETEAELHKLHKELEELRKNGAEANE
ncbi:MAG: hypothetical protein QGH51_07835 [Planctomycetota bacterium]|jgi:hypothetical protein|nr:hypothetical protein [Planctomycetota bacterium]